MTSDDANPPTSSQLLAEIMAASLSKNPALADKQRRLLQVLKGESKAAPPTDSPGTPSGPPVVE